MIAQLRKAKNNYEILKSSISILRRVGMLRVDPRLIKIHKRYAMSPAAFLERGGLLFPNRLFAIDDYGKMTYKDMQNAARNVAINLQREGVGSRSTVGILARNSRGFLIPYLACYYIGARAMIMNPYSSPAQIKNIIDEYGCEYFFFDSEFVDVADNINGVPCVGFGFDENSEQSYKRLEDMIFTEGSIEELPSDAGINPPIIMSSGTQGIPKAVVQAKSTMSAAIGALMMIPWDGGYVHQLTASLFHAWGRGNLLHMVFAGGTLILRRHFDPAQAIDDCVKYHPDSIGTSGIFLQAFLREYEKSETKIGPFKFVVSAGNAMPTSLVKAFTKSFGPVLINFYGSTEVGTIAVAGGQEYADDPSMAGRPLPGSKLKILLPDGSEAPTGETGVIYSANSMSSPSLLSDSEKLKVVDGMICVGDLGHLSDEGYLYVDGRADAMVIRGGENVFPKASQDCIADIPGVSEVFVRGIKEGLDARLIAYVVPDDSPEGIRLKGDSEAIKDFVKSHLAQTNVPDVVVWMDELPHNDAGKVVPRMLPDA